jgi:CheY-like chemotaxis protein
MPEPAKVIDLKTIPRAKVLVAEDDHDIASLIEDWLSEIYDVNVALNGKTAVQKAVWFQPQVILLDVVMPDIGGYDVVRLLQGTPQTKDIPVVVMTAKNFDDSTIKLIKAEGNVFGFLNKPFKPSELIKMLDVVIRGGRPHSPEGVAATGNVSPAPSPITPAPPPVISSGVDAVKSGEDAHGPREELGNPMGQRVVDLSGDSAEIGMLPRQRPRLKPKKTTPSEDEEIGFSSLRQLFTILGKAGLSFLVAVGLLFGVAEWTSRRAEEALGVPFFTPPLYPVSRFNSFLPYQWNDPKTSAPSYWDDGRVVYQFNQWGLRGPEFPLVTPSGVRRILVLGGTTTFGLGVGERDTVSVRLETLLNKNRSRTFQVINAGLWALSAEEQWAFVKGQGFNFKPEAILWLCENRAHGTPTTEGLRWLADHRWLASMPFAESRFIQLLVQLKIRGAGDPVPKVNDPFFREAEKMAKEQKVALTVWILPRGAVALTAFQENMLERLARTVRNKPE